ncbi:MAG: protein phosphatase 2C domain-containing protein [Candidatus Woesearchaeota archaeon]
MSIRYECAGYCIHEQKPESQVADTGFISKYKFADGSNYSVILMIADGVAEYPKSKVLSVTAAAKAKQVLRNCLIARQGSPIDWVSSAMKTAGNNVYELNQVKDDFGNFKVAKKGRTTFDVALINNHVLYYAHIGDGRIYLIDKNDKLMQLTKDHVDEHGNLLRFLGRSDEFQFDTGSVPLDDYKMLYMATDGTYKFVLDNEIEEIVKGNGFLQPKVFRIFERVQKPVGAAKELSQKLNISFESALEELIMRSDDKTAILVRWGEKKNGN